MFGTAPDRDRPVDVCVGIQWGDEGKGRVVDLLAPEYDIVARFGGGDNAGHSIEAGATKLALHVVPSGVLSPRTQLLIGAGTVISLRGLVDEFDTLAAAGVDLDRIKISTRAHVVFPYHAALDRASERRRGSSAIGTTGRGIGPAYIDRAARLGITFGDLAAPETLPSKIRHALAAHRAALEDDGPVAGQSSAGARAEAARQTAPGAEAPSRTAPRAEAGPQSAPLAQATLEPDAIVRETLQYAERIVPHLVESVGWLHERMERGERVLAEGAQGTMLDVTFGSYPYVTSSATLAGGACTGLGIGPTAVGRVLGVAKAYCTRVGGGPFPSELRDERGARLQREGREFGVTTGRPRRCGWYDAVAARYAARLNGLTDLAITKLDVLSGFEQVGIVTEYRDRNRRRCGIEALGDPDLQPVIEEHRGWTEDIRGVRRIADLPPSARAFVTRLAELTGVPVAAVSVGPERTQLAR